MIDHLIHWSLKNRASVLLIATLFCAYGIYTAIKLPVDVFPDLTAPQVKEIIMESSNKYNGEVVKPGSEETVPFSTLSVTGGYINGYNAVQMAMKTKGKKKSNGNASGGKSGSSKKDKKETVVP